MRLASVRRSLFTNDAARSKFLAHLMTGTKEILQTGQGVVGLLYSVFPLYIEREREKRKKKIKEKKRETRWWLLDGAGWGSGFEVLFYSASFQTTIVYY